MRHAIHMDPALILQNRLPQIALELPDHSVNVVSTNSYHELRTWIGQQGFSNEEYWIGYTRHSTIDIDCQKKLDVAIQDAKSTAKHGSTTIVPLKLHKKKRPLNSPEERPYAVHQINYPMPQQVAFQSMQMPGMANNQLLRQQHPAISEEEYRKRDQVARGLPQNYLGSLGQFQYPQQMVQNTQSQTQPAIFPPMLGMQSQWPPTNFRPFGDGYGMVPMGYPAQQQLHPHQLPQFAPQVMHQIAPQHPASRHPHPHIMQMPNHFSMQQQGPQQMYLPAKSPPPEPNKPEARTAGRGEELVRDERGEDDVLAYQLSNAGRVSDGFLPKASMSDGRSSANHGSGGSLGIQTPGGRDSTGMARVSPQEMGVGLMPGTSWNMHTANRPSSAKSSDEHLRKLSGRKVQEEAIARSREEQENRLKEVAQKMVMTEEIIKLLEDGWFPCLYCYQNTSTSGKRQDKEINAPEKIKSKCLECSDTKKIKMDYESYVMQRYCAYEVEQLEKSLYEEYSLPLPGEERLMFGNEDLNDTTLIKHLSAKPSQTPPSNDLKTRQTPSNLDNNLIKKKGKMFGLPIANPGSGTTSAGSVDSKETNKELQKGSLRQYISGPQATNQARGASDLPVSALVIPQPLPNIFKEVRNSLRSSEVLEPSPATPSLGSYNLKQADGKSLAGNPTKDLQLDTFDPSDFGPKKPTLADTIRFSFSPEGQVATSQTIEPVPGNLGMNVNVPSMEAQTRHKHKDLVLRVAGDSLSPAVSRGKTPPNRPPQYQNLTVQTQQQWCSGCHIKNIIGEIYCCQDCGGDYYCSSCYKSSEEEHEGHMIQKVGENNPRASGASGRNSLALSRNVSTYEPKQMSYSLQHPDKVSLKGSSVHIPLDIKNTGHHCFPEDTVLKGNQSTNNQVKVVLPGLKPRNTQHVSIELPASSFNEPANLKFSFKFSIISDNTCKFQDFLLVLQKETQNEFSVQHKQVPAHGGSPRGFQGGMIDLPGSIQGESMMLEAPAAGKTSTNTLLVEASRTDKMKEWFRNNTCRK